MFWHFASNCISFNACPRLTTAVIVLLPPLPHHHTHTHPTLSNVKMFKRMFMLLLYFWGANFVVYSPSNSFLRFPFKLTWTKKMFRSLSVWHLTFHLLLQNHCRNGVKLIQSIYQSTRTIGPFTTKTKTFFGWGKIQILQIKAHSLSHEEIPYHCMLTTIQVYISEGWVGAPVLDPPLAFSKEN